MYSSCSLSRIYLVQEGIFSSYCPHQYRIIFTLIIVNIFSWFKLWKIMTWRTCPLLFLRLDFQNVIWGHWFENFYYLMNLNRKNSLKSALFKILEITPRDLHSWRFLGRKFWFIFFDSFYLLIYSNYLGKKCFQNHYKAKVGRVNYISAWDPNDMLIAYFIS